MIRLQAWLVCIVAVLCANNAPLAAQSRAANQPAIAVMPGDEVWLISARESESVGAACPGDSLRCQVYANGHWQESHCQSILSSSIGVAGDTRETMVFVHGYNTDLRYAQKRGLQVYQNLLGCVANRPAVRYVIWAWKSEREYVRPVRDYTDKSRKAVMLGDKFAWTLNLLGPKPAIIIGYSLGSQIAVSALAQSSLYHGLPVQLAVIGAANECRFASGSGMLQNPGRICRTVVFHNRGDRVIRAAETICRVRFRQRFKSIDEFAPTRPQFFGQVDVVDITAVASKRHGITRYTALSPVQTLMQDLLNSNAYQPSSLASPFQLQTGELEVLPSGQVDRFPSSVAVPLQ